MSGPAVHLYEFDIQNNDPVLTRHIPSGSFAFIKELGSGTLADYMELESFSDTGMGWHLSKTQVFIFRTSTLGFNIENMRVWAPDTSALDQGPSLLQYALSGTWRAYSDFAASGAANFVSMPTSLPGSQNLFRQDGGSELKSIGDSEVSQYVYVNLVLDDTYPNGKYGSNVTGSFGRFEIRVNYDFVAQ